MLLVVGKKEAEEPHRLDPPPRRQDQKVMKLDDALAELAAEAVPPDLRRERAG